MEAILVLIFKCLLLGVIWAALIIPAFFYRGGWLRYAIVVAVISLICFFFREWAATINRMTAIALITLVVAWITSMFAFERESKNKSKVISFCCVMSPLAYLLSTWVQVNIL